MSVDSSTLISQLEACAKSEKKSGRASKKLCPVWGIPDLEITRWKFNEWDYYSAEKIGMPSTARGLYTLGPDRILLRGYNKFFNVGEVASTKTTYLESNLAGPYYATVKENGYLTLIAGYNGKLIVTSKNSSGPSTPSQSGTTTSEEHNHSLRAREWVLKHLADAGKTEKEFADLLETNNWTAAGEVCDDSFEEHVLSYGSDTAGVYLNGLNHNTAVFKTEHPAKVIEVSDAFGFRRTDFVEFHDYAKLVEFLENGQKTGKFGTRDVEGFVLRCKTKADNLDFFWKFKFEEPYFMYRSWREVLKIFLGSGTAKALQYASRSKHRTSCQQFLSFARRYLVVHPELEERITNQTGGMIEIRNAFLAEVRESQGASANSDGAVEQTLLGLDVAVDKYLLVTVATLGCGKSTVAEILTYLMHGSWGHHQNDAMKAGRGKSKWVQLQHAVFEDFFSGKDVVILDRNNSSRQERQQVFEQFDAEVNGGPGYRMHYICLNFLPEGPSSASKNLTRERVFARGDRHKTVKMSELNEKGISGIMSQFENRFQPVETRTGSDSQFDLVIDLEPGKSVDNVLAIANAMRGKYPGLDIPEFTHADVEAAFETILSHQSNADDASTDDVLITKIRNMRTVRSAKGDKANSAKDAKTRPVKKRRVNYFGLRIGETEAAKLMDVVRKTVPESILGEQDLQTTFHVTLAHARGSSAKFNEMWELHQENLSEFPVTKDGRPHFDVKDQFNDFKVVGLAWSPQAVAFQVEAQGCATSTPHITIGTRKGVPRKDSVKLFNGDFVKEGAQVEAASLDPPLIFEKQVLFASP